MLTLELLKSVESGEMGVTAAYNRASGKVKSKTPRVRQPGERDNRGGVRRGSGRKAQDWIDPLFSSLARWQELCAADAAGLTEKDKTERDRLTGIFADQNRAPTDYPCADWERFNRAGNPIIKRQCLPYVVSRHYAEKQFRPDPTPYTPYLLDAALAPPRPIGKRQTTARDWSTGPIIGLLTPRTSTGDYDPRPFDRPDYGPIAYVIYTDKELLKLVKARTISAETALRWAQRRDEKPRTPRPMPASTPARPSTPSTPPAADRPDPRYYWPSTAAAYRVWFACQCSTAARRASHFPR
jgi:hypothetical protein